MEAEEEAQAALATEIQAHAQLKVQIKQQRTINEGYHRQIQTLLKEKSNLQTNVSALEGTCGKCLPKWNLFNSSCYFFSTSEPSNVKMNWHDSRENCISRGADLVVIDNPQEQKYVSDVIEAANLGSMWDSGFWIGLTDIQTEGTWVWINNVTEVDQRYWIEGEPNNSGSGEDCGATGKSTSNPWSTRFDGKCNSKKMNWICEMVSN